MPTDDDCERVREAAQARAQLAGPVQAAYLAGVYDALTYAAGDVVPAGIAALIDYSHHRSVNP